VATALQDAEQRSGGSSEAVVSLAVQNAAPETGEPGQPRRARQTVVAAARTDTQDAQPWIVHGFAAFYLIVMTLAWLGVGRRSLTNPEYFAQSALVLTSIGLYHATPPGRKRG
jgi:hypothetical protein